MTLLARSLESSVVAEGIEDALDLEVITELGINLVQGYLFSKPLPVAELPDLSYELEH